MEIIDQIIIRATEFSRYYELKAAGYTVSWAGEGKICFCKYKQIT